jgi:hypothetical protein
MIEYYIKTSELERIKDGISNTKLTRPQNFLKFSPNLFQFHIFMHHTHPKKDIV